VNSDIKIDYINFTSLLLFSREFLSISAAWLL